MWVRRENDRYNKIAGNGGNHKQYKIQYKFMKIELKINIKHVVKLIGWFNITNTTLCFKNMTFCIINLALTPSI